MAVTQAAASSRRREWAVGEEGEKEVEHPLLLSFITCLGEEHPRALALKTRQAPTRQLAVCISGKKKKKKKKIS